MLQSKSAKHKLCNKTVSPNNLFPKIGRVLIFRTVKMQNAAQSVRENWLPNRNSLKETKKFFTNLFLLSVTFQNVLHLLCTWVKNQPGHMTKKIGQKPGPKHFENATATSSNEGVLKQLKTETIPTSTFHCGGGMRNSTKNAMLKLQHLPHLGNSHSFFLHAGCFLSTHQKEIIAQCLDWSKLRDDARKHAKCCYH